jgi:hypothetical protein
MPVVEGLQIARVADRGPGGLDQDRLQVLVSLAAAALIAPPGRFVVAGAQARPGGQVRGGGEELGDLDADLRSVERSTLGS